MGAPSLERRVPQTAFSAVLGFAKKRKPEFAVAANETSVIQTYNVTRFVEDDRPDTTCRKRLCIVSPCSLRGL